MAKEHLDILKQGVEVWNRWREENPEVRANLYRAKLRKADLRKADLRNVYLWGADLYRADLGGADLREACLVEVNLERAELMEADLRKADLRKAFLWGTRFYRTDLSGADLRETDLIAADFDGANLSDVRLEHSNLNKAKLVNTTLSGCYIYGISAWDLKFENTKQTDLIITPHGQPKVSVDNLEVAQFIYLLLNNENIRDVIDTIGKKGVLILGRFTPERKAILHSIRDELRKLDYLPIMFEFDPLSTEPTIKTLSTLAHMSRFVIADLTDAKSVMQELEKLTTEIPSLPVKLILHRSAELPPMGDGWMMMPCVLKPPYFYDNQGSLVADLQSEVIEPANQIVKKYEEELEKVRREFFGWQLKSPKESSKKPPPEEVASD